MKMKKIGVLSAAVLLMSQMCWQPVKQQETIAASDVSVMTAVDSTYELIKEFEGFSCECRWDNTQWTIGYGTKCPFDHPTNGSYQLQKGGHTVTEDEAKVIMSDLMGYFVNIRAGKICTISKILINTPLRLLFYPDGYSFFFHKKSSSLYRNSRQYISNTAAIQT